MNKDVIVIGAGFAGTTAAYLLKNAGFKVTVLEAAEYPGGGCWTRYHGKYPYTIGPRIFYTHNKKTFEFLNSFVALRKFDTKTCSYIEQDDQIYNYPLQYSDLPRMPDAEKINKELEECSKSQFDMKDFETYWISAVGKTLYNKFVNEYSKKMWSLFNNKELSADFAWINRGTPIKDGDIRLFGNQFQGYPYDLCGYNSYFEQALSGVVVHFKSSVNSVENDGNGFFVSTKSGETFSGNIVINTGHTDEIFNYRYGELQFSGRDIIPLVLPTKNPFGDKDYHWIHYSGNEPYTRVVDFNKVTGFESENSLITLEVPSNSNRLYPKQTQPEITRYKQYVADFPENFYAIGRLGKFKYTGISDAIEQAHDIVEEILT
jgi:UDP-galactopyranose mutase